MAQCLQCCFDCVCLICCCKAPYASKLSYRACMQGLDDSGKTTILYQLATGSKVETIPTIGFNTETVKGKKCNFLIWDNGGHEKIRPLWRHYYGDEYDLMKRVSILIWVVDCTNSSLTATVLVYGFLRTELNEAHIPPELVKLCQNYYSDGDARMELSSNLLHEALSNPVLCEAVLLVYANKQDKYGAYSTDEIVDKLALHKVKQQWRIQACCGLTGDGLWDGIAKIETMLLTKT